VGHRERNGLWATGIDTQVARYGLSVGMGTKVGTMGRFLRRSEVNCWRN
jgi:hypothetical protein